MTKTKETLNIIVVIVAAGFAGALGKAVAHKVLQLPMTYKRTETHHVNLDDAEYTMTTKNTDISIKATDKITGTTTKYDVNLDDSVQKLKQVASNIPDEQKKYLAQNKKLVADASKAYGFIIANDYKLVRYCAQYHPVANVKEKHDIRFKDKKRKAEHILNEAFGPDGAKNFINTLISNPDVEKTFYAQVENDYQQVKSMALQDGIPNFTRQQYCKLMDEEADFVVETDYKNFKTVLPNF